MTDQAWYQAGLRFECRRCGRCCGGEEGYVWVNEDEITAMAYRLRLNRGLFVANFVRNVGGRKSLVELPNGDCIFYDREIKGCKVYVERPIQCQTWPFWDSNVDMANSWKKTAKFCPGCNKGDVHFVEEIEIKRRAMEL